MQRNVKKTIFIKYHSKKTIFRKKQFEYPNKFMSAKIYSTHISIFCQKIYQNIPVKLAVECKV